MKRFKDFLKKTPVIVDAIPVHGNHSKLKAVLVDILPVHGKHSRSDLKETIMKNPDDYGMHDHDFHDVHGPSNQEWKHLNTSYKPHPEDKHSDIHRSIKSYTLQSSVNHALLSRAVGKPSALDSYEHYKANRKSWQPDHSPTKFAEAHKHLHTQIRHLDHAISSHKLKDKATVYHGCGFNPDEYASKHPDRHVHLPAYTSTSTRREKADGFASEHLTDNGQEHKHVLRIHLPKGHQALPILHRSEHSDEAEVLLHRDSKFKISDKPTHISGRGSLKIHYWDAHPVK